MTPNPNTPEVNRMGAMSNAIVAIQAQIDAWNANLAADYKNKHDSWNINESNHPGMNGAEPQPPNAYVMGWDQDPTTGPGSVGPWGETPIYWPTPVQGTHPVCAPLPGPPKGIASMGSAFMQQFAGSPGPGPSPFNSSVPLFSNVTAPDGSRWLRIS
jgi:hypothetical protein